jgi:outer membrane protein assembly factor BamB
MGDRSLGPASRRIHSTVVIAAASALLLSAPPASGEWTHFHGNAANTGFVDLVTNPAGAGSLSVPGLGTFAPGAGPVIGPDGAVHLGTEQGKLLQLHRNGAPSWTSELPQIFGGRPSIVASPAVGADGSVYVIGVLTLREHKAGTTVTRNISEVHKFSPGGRHLWRTALPARELGRGGYAGAPPNIWQSSGTETVMVPAVFTLGSRGSSRSLLMA